MHLLNTWSRGLDARVVADAPMRSLGDAARSAYRDIFSQAVAEGSARPMLISHLLVPFLLLASWLSIPHVRRPWLYSTRWLVLACVISSNIYHIWYVSSTNFACMYASGMASTWMTMTTMNLLVWTRPQHDAARAVRPRSRGPSKDKPNSKNEAEPELVWQPFPADDSFLQRFGWSADLILCFRGAAWNWSSPTLPRPTLPPKMRPGAPVDVASVPRVTRQGYARCMTEAEFLRHRSLRTLYHYMMLDFLAVTMMRDPYFVLGPDNVNYELPPLLQRMSPSLRLAYRELFALLAIISAIDGIFSFADLVQYLFIKACFPSRGGFVWHYASHFGSFGDVFERGLAGWWGSCWHQTFRVQFSAPVTYLLREGYLKRGSSLATASGILVAFASSGILHAFGSATSISLTKPWRSFAFFMLQPVGLLVQRILRPLAPKTSRPLHRLFNLLFTFFWLYVTAPLFIDDISSAGVWLFEPVPISPLRFLGFGQPGDHWWRWDRDAFPKYYSAQHWWQSGFAF